jgi:hypothetical protein
MTDFDDKYRDLGSDPKTGKPVSVRRGRYGPVVQIGHKDDEDKPTFASLRKGQDIEVITLDEALELFDMPRTVGETEDGQTVKANYGRFGPYIQYGKKYLSLKKDTPEEITLEKALSLIKFDLEKVIKIFEGSEIQILNGHNGPNIWNGVKGKGRRSITIAKFFADKDPATLTLDECKRVISGDVKPKAIKQPKKSTYLTKASLIKVEKKSLYDINDAVKAEVVASPTQSWVEKSKIGWDHPIVTSGEYEGFNNASMEHFGDSLKGFAREMTQNSLDAAINSDQPVVINLKLHDVAISDIPNVEELKNNFQMGLDTSIGMETNPDPKVIDFYSNAIDLLEKDSLKVFEFSDFNTTGMSSGGDKMLDDTFYVYMKTKDFSQKPDGSLGSFGIGKSAPYAVSNLRTLITSSVYSLNGVATQATQGKSILTTLRVSNKDGSHTFKNSDGYWGIKDGSTHINGYIDELSPYFQRIDKSASKANLGSKISILGFAFHENWRERMAYDIAQNFFAAINNGKLVVNIGNNSEYTLNNSTIQNIKETINPDVVARHDDGFVENLDIRMSYLKAINDPESFSIEKDIKNLGKCRIDLAVSEGLPKRVCFIRDGMYITDELSINKLKRFSEFNDFIVVFQCLNKDGNSFLGKMEPPAHNTFEVSRLKENAQKGRDVLNEVAQWIRDELKDYAYDQIAKTVFVNELEEFFNYEIGEDDGGKEVINEINPFSDVIIKLKPTPKKKTRKKEVIKDDDGEDLEVPDPYGDGPMTPDYMDKGSGGGDSEGLSGTSIEKNKVMKPINVKNFRFIKQAPNSIKMFFDYSKSKELKIEVFLSGSDEDMRLPILNSDIGEVRDGALHTNVNPNERNCINVKLANYSYGSLKVEAHEI